VNETTEVEQVRTALETFFEGLDARDVLTICRIWHPDAQLFLNSAILNTRSLSFLLSLPDLVEFKIKEIRHIDVHQMIATARVDYAMPIGSHAGFFNLVKAEGEWRIANWVDHGVAMPLSRYSA
jgi:hypothetical protein